MTVKGKKIRPGFEGGPACACGCAGPPSFFFARIVALLRAAGDNGVRNGGEG